MFPLAPWSRHLCSRGREPALAPRRLWGGLQWHQLMWIPCLLYTWHCITQILVLSSPLSRKGDPRIESPGGGRSGGVGRHSVSSARGPRAGGWQGGRKWPRLAGLAWPVLGGRGGWAGGQGATLHVFFTNPHGRSCLHCSDDDIEAS